MSGCSSFSIAPAVRLAALSAPLLLAWRCSRRTVVAVTMAVVPVAAAIAIVRPASVAASRLATAVAAVAAVATIAIVVASIAAALHGLVLGWKKKPDTRSHPPGNPCKCTCTASWCPLC